MSKSVKQQLHSKGMESGNEQKDCLPKHDDLLEKDVGKKGMTDLSDDYWKEMINKVNNRSMSLSDGDFLKSDITECPQVSSNQTDKQSLLPEQDLTDDFRKADSNNKFDKFELTAKINNDNEERLHLEEKPTVINTELEDDNKSIDEKNDDKEDLLSSKKLLIVETLNVSNIIDKQSLLPVQDPTEESKKTDSNNEFDKLKLTAEISNNHAELLHLEEKPSAIDGVIEDDNKCTNEKNYKKQDLLSNEEPLIADKSNSFAEIAVIENKSHVEKAFESEMVAVNESKKEMPVFKLDNFHLNEVFSGTHLEAFGSHVRESDIVINKIQQFNWLRRSHSNITDEREEVSEDSKTSSKSNRKRSSQSRNRKAKAADFSKRDGTDDKSKKKFSDVQSAISSKIELVKSTSVQATEKSKDMEATHLLVSGRVSIGRGRGDRRKISLGTNKGEQKSQARRQSIDGDQSFRNDTHRNSSDVRLPPKVEKRSSKNEAISSSLGFDVTFPPKLEKRFNKNEANFSSQGSDVILPPKLEKRSNQNEAISSSQVSTAKLEQVENTTEKIAVSRGSRKLKNEGDWEAEVDSQVHQNVEFLRDQPPVENTAKHNEPSTQECKVEMDIKKEQLPSEREEEWKTKVHSQVDKKVQVLANQSLVENTAKCNQPSIQECKIKIDVKKEQLPSDGEYQESKIRPDTKLQSRSIHGRSTDKSNLEKIPPLVRGFGQNTDKTNNGNNDRQFQNQNFSSKNNLNKFSEQINEHQNSGRYNENRINQSFGRDENCSNKYSSSGNAHYQDFPRWNHNNYLDKQNVRSNESTLYTSNRHRVVEENEDLSSKNQIFTDRIQGSRRYSDRCPENRSAGRYNLLTAQQKYFERSQGTYSNRHFDRNQNSRGLGERFYNEKNHESETDKREQELYNRSPTSYNKNNTKSQTIVTKSSDFSSSYQELPDKKKSSNSANETYGTGYPVNEDYNGKNECAGATNHHFLNKDYNSSYQDEYKYDSLCEEHEEELRLSNMLQRAQSIVYQDSQHKSDVKSQKDSDNIQQAKVQKGLNPLPVICQHHLSSTLDQDLVMHGRDAQLANVTQSQTSQSEDLSSYRNISKRDGIQPTEIQSAYLQHNQAILDPTSQFSSTLATEPKPNVVVTFEGNHNVQRALGIDPRAMNQYQVSQVNNDLPPQSKTSPAPSQSQFLQPAAVNPQITLACTHQSTMNVNAPPFEVKNKSDQKLNYQQVYAAQSTASNYGQGRLIAIDNNVVLEANLMNQVSNYSEDFLKLHQEVSELSKQLATKQAQLLALQMKILKITRLTDEAALNVMSQVAIPPNQASTNCQHLQDQNQILPPNYAPVINRNYPPGFSNVLLNVQSTQMNSYEMLASTASLPNYSVDNLASNSASDGKVRSQTFYSARSNMAYQQQSANDHTNNDKTKYNAATSVDIPKRAEQRQIRGSGNLYAQQ